MLLSNEDVSYSKETHEYSLTETGVLSKLPYSDDELSRRVNDWKKWLPRWNRKVYDIIYATNQPDARKELHYKIFLNMENEANAIIDAIVEYIFEVMENGVDLDGVMPESVKRILFNGNVTYQGYLSFEYDDDHVYGTDY